MLLIEKTTIEKLNKILKKLKEKGIGDDDIDLFKATKEVEVVDMANSFNEAVRERQFNETVAKSLTSLGYQLIKIKQ